jgi:chromosome segregation ATPase
VSAELSLPFDQYQRYRLVADLIGSVKPRGERWTVLDVGGRTGLLRKFLKREQVTLVDPVCPERKGTKGYVQGAGQALPFRDGSFDVVCAFDTLEHVPENDRRAFARECARVARHHAILAGPYADPKVVKAEALLRQFLEKKLELEHAYLAEHHELGLPDRAKVEGWLKRARKGTELLSIGHGNLDRWLALMGLSMYLDRDPALRGLAKELNSFYNAALYRSDHGEEVYRHAVVASFEGAPLPDLEGLLDPPIAPKGTWSKFNKLVPGVAAFDQAKRSWREERKAFEQSVRELELDLEGHRTSLAASREQAKQLREQVEDLEADLAGHRASLGEQRSDAERLSSDAAKLETQLTQREASLKEVHADLAERDKQLAQAVKVAEALREDLEVAQAIVRDRDLQIEAGSARQADLEADLDGHRVSLEELSEARAADLADFEARREALEADLTGHRHTLAELVAERDAWREQANALDSDLAGHRSSLANLGEERAALSSSAHQLAAELAEHRERLALLIEERDGLAATVETQAADLEGHRASLANLRSELEQVTSKLRARDAELGEALDREQALGHRAAELELQLADSRGQFQESQAGEAELRAVIERLESELVDLAERLGEREAAWTAERNRVETLEAAGEVQRADLKEHRASLAELGSVRERLEAQILELAERGERQAADLEQGRHARQALTESLEATREDLEAHRASLAELTELRLGLERRLVELGEAHEARGVELAERTNERDQALDRELALGEELRQWREREAFACEEREALDRIRQTLEADLQGHRHALAERGAEVERLTEALLAKAARLEERTAEVAVLEARRDGLELERESLAKDLEEHRKTLAARQADVEAERAGTEATLEQLKAEVARLRDERAQADEVRETLEADLAGHRAALQAREAEYEELRSAAEQYARTRDEARSELERLSGELRAADRAAEHTDRERQRLQRQRDEAVSEADASQARLAEQVEALEDLRELHAETQIELRRREHQIDGLERELTELRRRAGAEQQRAGEGEA